jgi:hypothetical protein
VHGVAIGAWDRDGDLDLYAVIGGALPGDRFYNSLFQNPGHGRHWLNVKLIGVKTNRSAIGARVKAVLGQEAGGRAVFRHVTSGSSFGGNPLEVALGLGRSQRIVRLEVFWPTSGTTQVFTDVPVDRAIEVTEFATTYRTRSWSKILLKEGE